MVTPGGSLQPDPVLLAQRSSRLPSAYWRARGQLPSMCLLGGGWEGTTDYPGSCWCFGAGGAGTRHTGPWVQHLQPTLMRGALADVFGRGSLFGGREVVFGFYHSSRLF